MDAVNKLRRSGSFVRRTDSTTSLADIGALVSDSFSSDGGVSDDSRSSSWMHKIDVSNFEKLQQYNPADTEPRQTSATLLDHGLYSRPLAGPGSVSEPSPSFVSPADSGCSTNTVVMSPPLKQRRYNQNQLIQHQLVESSEEEEQIVRDDRIYPKPIYSYSCLIALSLKNSKTGRLTVAEIYAFMCENFPYFKTAPAGWKNSVRHNLSLNKCFQKIELETPGGHGRKSCLWTMNPAKKNKMDSEIRKWREKDVSGVHESLANPADLEAIEAGKKGLPPTAPHGYVLRNFPEIIGHPRPQSTQLLLVERPSTTYTRYTYTANPQRQNNVHVIGAGQPSHRSLSWTTDESSPGGSWSRETGGSTDARRVMPPCTPPRPAPISPYVHTGSDCGSAFSTPHQMRSASQQHLQSSPFAHTPPYSPNVHSPQFSSIGAHQLRPVHTDWLSAVTANCSTPRHTNADYQRTYAHHTNLEDYYGISNSPLKMNLQYCGAQNPYDTTASALNNNSLLQTALAASPCRTDFTLQRL